MASFPHYDNSDAIVSLIITIFSSLSNTAVVVILPNLGDVVCVQNWDILTLPSNHLEKVNSLHSVN